MASGSGNDPSSSENNAGNGLENFIAEQLSAQRENQNNADDNIDEEKLNRFLSRAVSESRRMNQEVEKSKAKHAKLEEEFGAEKMAAWQLEHASEVLEPKQVALLQEEHVGN